MLKYFFTILVVALSACQTSTEALKEVPWQYQTFNEHDYQRLDIDSVPNDLVVKIMENYESNPGQEKFSKIRLVRAFRDEKTQKKFLKFSITTVSDIYAVYEVTEDNVLSNKFLLSQW